MDYYPGDDIELSDYLEQYLVAGGEPTILILIILIINQELLFHIVIMEQL